MFCARLSASARRTDRLTDRDVTYRILTFSFYPSETESKPKFSENAAVDQHDARSSGASSLSSGTIVSDLNSCGTPTPLMNLKHQPVSETVQDPPPPSPYTLRNKKLSVGSADSFYDEPYCSLEEIDAGITPLSSLPPTHELVEYSAGPEEELKISNIIPNNLNTYGVMDKPEDEAVVMEVKEIENPPSAEDNTIQDFDEVLNSLLFNEQSAPEPSKNPGPFTLEFHDLDSTILMF